MLKKTITFILILIASFSLASCIYDDSEVIIIGKGSWESNNFYNDVVRIIIEQGYDKKVEVKPVTTPILVEGLKQKEIHINVETWSENMPTYQNDIKEGHYEELGVNFNDNEQGIFTTQYFAEYMANQLDKDINDLYIEDLIEFKEFLPIDEQNNSKALIYGGSTEWEVTEFLIKKFSNHEIYPNLVNNFTFEPIRSTPILNQMLIDAYQEYDNSQEINKNTVWVGYNWKPTAVMGRFEMVLLKDTEKDYVSEEGLGNVPKNNITIIAIPEFKEKHPEIHEMLSSFETSADDASTALSYLEEDSDRTFEQAAIWWLTNNKELWKPWVNDDAYKKIVFYLETNS